MSAKMLYMMICAKEINICLQANRIEIVQIISISCFNTLFGTDNFGDYFSTYKGIINILNCKIFSTYSVIIIYT